MEIIPPEANPISRRSHPERVSCRLSTKPEVTREEKFPYCTEISKVGKFRNIISGMRGEGKYEVHSFRQELRQKIHSENFNAAEMAEKAPAKLKAWAEENGMNLEEMLTRRAQKASESNEELSSPPENQEEELRTDSLLENILIDYLALELENTILSMSEDDKSEIHSLSQEIHQAIQDGTYDTAALLEKVPVGLKAWAEENSIDLEEALNQWAGKVAIPEELQAINTVS